MDRSTTLNAVVLAVALSLLLGPLLLFPAEAPPDRIKYYVESVDYDQQAWDDLEYDNFSAAEREVFDSARTASPGVYNATLEESPARLTPPSGGITVYDVGYDDGYYLLQVKHLTDEIDLVSQLLPRLLAVALSGPLGIAAVYRQFLS